MPTDATSFDELENIVGQLSRRENRWEVFRRIAAAYNVRLEPDEIWLLARICLSEAAVDLAELAHEHGIADVKLEEIVQRLAKKGLIVCSAGGALDASVAGRQMFLNLSRTREARLSKMLAKWTHERQPEIKTLLDRLSRTLMAELPIEPRAFVRE